jgi:hypothetical protein
VVRARAAVAIVEAAAVQKVDLYRDVHARAA